MRYIYWDYTYPIYSKNFHYNVVLNLEIPFSNFKPGSPKWSKLLKLTGKQKISWTCELESKYLTSCVVEHVGRSAVFKEIGERQEISLRERERERILRQVPQKKPMWKVLGELSLNWSGFLRGSMNHLLVSCSPIVGSVAGIRLE